MTVKRKASKPVKHIQMDIDDIINKGGRTTTEAKASAPSAEAETRFTLRIPQKMIDKIDKNRTNRVGNVSRNQWIIEAISESLK